MSIPINNVPCTSVAVNKLTLTSPLPGVWRLQSAVDINVLQQRIYKFVN